MDLPDVTPKPEEPTRSDNTFPEETILPEGFTALGSLAPDGHRDSAHLPRARRRRAQRMLVPPAADERASLLDALARRAFPSFEFFVFAFLCGVILGAAYLLNAPALLLLGILLAPLLTPWVGLTLAAVTGSWRFFFLTLGGLLVAGTLVFLTGALAGLAGHLWVNLPFFYARTHAQLWWPDLLVVALGAALLAISFIRSEQKPILASVMLAYGLFLPVSAAGIGLGIGKNIDGVPLWPNGLLVFLVHLALATLVGGFALVVLRFKPMKTSGYFLPVFLGLLSLGVLIILTGLVSFIRDGITAARRIAPTPTILILPSATSTVFKTPTPTPNNLPSATLSQSPTIQPTPTYAVIAADPQYGGALVRTVPGGGTQLATLINGSIVQVLPDIQDIGTETWVLIRINNIEGWILEAVLEATTLAPSPVPTITLTTTP